MNPEVARLTEVEHRTNERDRIRFEIAKIERMRSFIDAIKSVHGAKFRKKLQSYERFLNARENDLIERLYSI